EKVKAEFHSTPVDAGTFTADPSGNISGTLAIPASLAAGSHTLTLTGEFVSSSYAFQVVNAPAPSASTSEPTPTTELPHTGASTLRPTALAILLIILGGVTLVGARRRRTI